MEDTLKVIRITYNDGFYVGQYTEKDGVPVENGTGIFTWDNGDRYEGSFVDGARTGYGVFAWADGKRYEGDFKDDAREGIGKLTWADGSFYEGDFLNGQMHGKGRLVWASGEVYVGWFAKDKMEGYGIHYAKDGSVIYEGEWIESCPVYGQPGDFRHI